MNETRELKSSIKIAVIGAGISGIAAAVKLHQKGFKNVILLEAQERVGGRIHTIAFENHVLELGAQWIHGIKENPLYDMANERSLISVDERDIGVEGEGHFYVDTGEEIDADVMVKVIAQLDEINQNICDNKFSNASNAAQTHNSILTPGMIFKEEFEKYISSKKDNPCDNKELLWAIFDWYMRFEKIDNACNDLNELSLKSYTEWCDCDGNSLINFKNGYQSIANELLNELPIDCLHLNSPIEKIEILNDNHQGELSPGKVALILKGSNEVILADHVILTVSIGFLRANKSFIKLPEKKAQIIESLGFGTINKIYLVFETPFWRSSPGFQLIWTSKKHRNEHENEHENGHQNGHHQDGCDFPNWVYGISGFDVVRNQPNVLVGWIGGKAAEEMEQVESDHQVGEICVQVLRRFLSNYQIPNPSKVIRSRWHSNEYIRGSYSHRSLDYEKNNLDVTKDLVEPLYYTHKTTHNQMPCVLFAGEATDKEFFSTTHGALRSGLREAQRLIQFWENNCSEFEKRIE